MNFKLSNLFFVAVLMISGTGYLTAQSNSFGLRVGINSATIDSEDENGNAFQPDNRVGLDIGLMYSVGITETFSIQPELHFLQKGFKISTDFLGDKVESNAILNYLELPVLGKYTFGSETFQAHLIGGPSVGYAINGKFTAELNGEKEEEDIDFEEDEISRLDFGLTIGGGIGLPVNGNTFFVDVRYLLGLANISEVEDTRERNRGLSIALGFLVPMN